MLTTLHWLTLVFYWTAPIVAAGVAVARGGQKQGQSILTYLTALVAGAMLGTSLTVLHARDVNGTATAWQFFLAIYFATGLMLVLRMFNALLVRVLHGPNEIRIGWRHAVSAAARGVILIVLGLPYVISALMIYRPKAMPLTDPMGSMRFRYSPVEFESTDGVSLSGWWIPSRSSRGNTGAFESGTRTVIVCHGWGQNKSTQLVMARGLVPAGYNVLIFDFRGHGESGGQLTTMGDLERRDVLGAVRWLKENHPRESQKIFGLGASTGAAALIAAAADRGPEGQAIEALAVFGAFDDLSLVLRNLAGRSLSSPMDWLTTWMGIGLASVQTGTNLWSFRPAELIHDIWPRPILIIHATYDMQIPFDRGRKLFDDASFPKQPLWLANEFEDEALEDDEAATAVREFFENARPIPVI